MDNWTPTPLKKCGKWYSGGTPSKDNDNYWNGDIPWISAKSMYDIYISDSVEKVTKEGANNGTRIVPAKTILILVRGSMLYRRVPVCITTRDMTFNQDVKAIIPKQNVVPEYLLYWLMSHENVLLSKVEVTGMGAGKLATDILENTLVPLPPLAEQKAIAQILGTWDEAIATTEALIEALTLRKRALMQRLLTGEVRFPGFDDEWEEVKLGDVLQDMTDYVANGSFASLRENVNVFDDEKFAYYVRLTDLRLGLGHQNQKYVDKSSYDFLSRSALFGEETLVANIGANVGEVVLMPQLDKSATIAPNMIVLRSNEQTDAQYLYYYLSSSVGQKNIARVVGGSSQPKLNKTDLKTIHVDIPSHKEQTAISKILRDVETHINLLSKEKQKLQEQKRGLMQVLLTGEVRVKT